MYAHEEHKISENKLLGKNIEGYQKLKISKDDFLSNNSDLDLNYLSQPALMNQMDLDLGLEYLRANFNISFPMTEIVEVTGDGAHSFFKWAKENHGKASIPKWNFHKIIIGKDGKVFDTFSSITKPTSKRYIASIEKALKS